MEFGQRAQVWLLHSLVASSLLLLLAAALIRVVHQPARRRQIGSWSIRAALLLPLLVLGPTWLSIRLPAQPAPSPPVVAIAPTDLATQPRTIPIPAEELPDPTYVMILPNAVPAAEQPQPAPTIAPAAAAPEPIPTPQRQWHVATAVVLAYFLAAGVLLIRWLFGHLALHRIMARRKPRTPGSNNCSRNRPTA